MTRDFPITLRFW